MKLAILGPLNRNYEEIRLMEEAKKSFDVVSYFPTPQVIVEVNGNGPTLTFKNKDVSEYDVILPRIPRSYKNFGTSLIYALNYMKKKIPLEPWSIIASHNKFMTLIYLQEQGIPIPETHLSLKRSVLDNVFDKIAYPVVLKLLYGSKGIGVMFADSKQSAISVMDALERFKEPMFVEAFIPPGNEDIRAYVVGGHVIASMKRVAQKEDRRANIGMGGEGHVYKLTKEEERLALKVSKVMGTQICGVDIMPGPDGPVIIETNVNAQFQGIEKATKKNVAGEIIKHLKGMVNK